MTSDELKEVLEKHRKWLAKEQGGARADLRGANLREADLRFAALQSANLRDADLTGADLRGGDLMGADLRDADMSGAYLFDADLHNANLNGADLRGANLDYSCWPLWCGSLNVEADKRLACQLLYHALRVMQGVDDPEVRKVCENPDVIALANQFHRADECGRIK